MLTHCYQGGCYSRKEIMIVAHVKYNDECFNLGEYQQKKPNQLDWTFKFIYLHVVYCLGTHLIQVSLK